MSQFASKEDMVSNLLNENQELEALLKNQGDAFKLMSESYVKLETKLNDLSQAIHEEQCLSVWQAEMLERSKELVAEYDRIMADGGKLYNDACMWLVNYEKGHK
jgi:predicted  nucleic acid-binding Zn-ribbon protein